MKHSFFKPFIGPNYNKGISGKKILVLGASFYCPKTHCPFFNTCTSTAIKDSSQFDSTCPEYKNHGIYLHDEPTNNIENWYPTYQTFAKGIALYFEDENYDNIWSHLFV